MFNSTGITTSKSESLIKEIILKINKRLKEKGKEIKKIYPQISYEEAQTISSYSVEFSEAKDKIYYPYKILNQNLVEQDRAKGIKNVSKYLFIFLKSLRKLKRYYPTNYNHLYRCINKKVELTIDIFEKNKIMFVDMI